MKRKRELPITGGIHPSLGIAAKPALQRRAILTIQSSHIVPILIAEHEN